MENYTLKFQEAENLYTSGSLQAAAALYTEVIQLDPSNLQANCRMYEILNSMGDGAQAIMFLNAALNLDPRIAGLDVHYKVARALEDLNKPNEAELALKRARTFNGGCQEAWEYSLRKLEDALQIKKLLNLFEEMIAIHPELESDSNKEHVNFRARSPYWRKESAWYDLKYLVSKIFTNAKEAPVLNTISYISNGDLLAAWNECQNSKDTSDDIQALTALLAFYIYEIFEKRPFGDAAVEALAKLKNTRYAKDLLFLNAELTFRFEGKNNKTIENALNCTSLNKTSSISILVEKANLAEAEIYYSQGKMTESFKAVKSFIELQNERISKASGTGNLRILDELNTYAMGHCAYLPDCYLKMQKLGWISEGDTTLLAPPWRVTNKHLVKYWEQYFNVIYDPEKIRKITQNYRDNFYCNSFQLMPDGRAMSANQAMATAQAEWERQRRKPLLKLSDEDYSKGWEYLIKRGVPKDNWFVALHVREPGFKNQKGCTYNSHRDSDINTYMASIKAITDKGGWVIRMGEPSMQPLAPMPQVIDYAHDSAKTDWLDIFIATACRFFLSSAGGMILTPKTFGVPVVGVNYPPTPPQYNSHDIFLPKLLKIKSENRLMTFKEWLNEPIVHSEDGTRFQQLGLEFIDNTEDEILEITKEMLNRFDGTLQYSIDDQARQSKFKSYLPNMFGDFISRIGNDFLVRYSKLL